MARRTPAAPVARARTPAIGIAGIAVLLAIPRLARLAYPQVWIEDDSYLHDAFLLARGFLPYRDFPLPHFPTLEGLLAAVFLIAPISIRTAELVTQAAAFAGSLLVFGVGRRIDGPLTASFAALVFATSALLFRYHVFEREVFVVVPVLSAVLLTARPLDARQASRTAVAAGALLVVAMTLKLTAFGAALALVVDLWLASGRRPAAIAMITIVALGGILTIGLAAAFGTDFVVQVFLFRAAHATFPSLAVKLDELRYTMDVSFAFGACGVALIVWRRAVDRWRAPLMQLAAGFVVLVLLNPTYWAHTGIELLPWLSLAAGYLLATVVRGLAGRERRRTPALVCAGAAVALLLFVAPIRNLNWQAGDGSVYGFGYRDRAELETMAAFVRSQATADAPVATPPIIAFAANRLEAIPYAEIAGTVDELTAAVRRDGYWSALRSAAGRDEPFWESVEASRDRMAPRLVAALDAHRVAVLINDSPADLIAVPLVDVPQDRLERAGYTLEKLSAHYEAWIPLRAVNAGPAAVPDSAEPTRPRD